MASKSTKSKSTVVPNSIPKSQFSIKNGKSSPSFLCQIQCQNLALLAKFTTSSKPFDLHQNKWNVFNPMAWIQNCIKIVPNRCSSITFSRLFDTVTSWKKWVQNAILARTGGLLSSNMQIRYGNYQELAMYYIYWGDTSVAHRL